MKSYFLTILKNLDKLTGLRQYEKLCQMPEYKAEIAKLLDVLVRVCEQFPMIPDVAKCRIIDTNIVADPEFTGLNARVVFKWLNQHKELYSKPQQEQDENWEPLTGEAREKRLQEWLEALSKTEAAVTERSDPYKTVREQWTSHSTEKYKPLTPEQVYEKARHLEYIKHNYDANGKKVDHWITEEEFNKQYDNGLV